MTPKTPVYLTTTQDTARPCPTCGRVLDGVTCASWDEPPTTPPVPTQGDVTVCAYCATVLILTDLGWRIATAAEIDALPGISREIVVEFIRAFAGRPRPPQ